MLSINKLLLATTQYSCLCVRNKTIYRGTLCLSEAQINERRYAHAVPKEYILGYKDARRYGLPPRVAALEKHFVYSEYIEQRKLKFGYARNKIIIGKLREKAKAIKLAKVTEPVYSSMLNHLTGTKVLEPEPKPEEKYEDVEDGEKPIHMPYASTDSFENIEMSSAPEPELKMPYLNENYRRMYEKYLDEKQKNLEESLPEVEEDTVDLDETSVDTSGDKRPVDSTERIPSNWMNDYEQFDDVEGDEVSWKSPHGTPMLEVPVSTIPCGGCGALLHCKDPAIPGYLPSELFVNQRNRVLKSSVCQRCHFIKHYQTTLDVKVSPDEYPVLLGHIKKKKVAVILMVDLTDFPCSIWPGIMDIIGKTTNVFVVGNKVDLLPNDGKNFLKNVENSLVQSLNEMGISKANIKSVKLISAKTGYGVEELINTLYKQWEYKGDVYMIGCTNVGKSSLFNALLRSDYCKVQAADLIQRATISPWPGTTLNLLKFPILRPARWRLYLRLQRIVTDREGVAEGQKFREEKLRQSRNIKHAMLRGHIGQTFHDTQRKEGLGFYGEDKGLNTSGYLGYNEEDDIYKNSRWCFDTPGTIHPEQVLHLLTTEELMLTLPQEIIRPRTFDLRKGHTLFLAGLGRLDFVKGATHIKCTVFGSRELPVTICDTKTANKMYQKFLHSEAFVVPKNDPERLKLFPALESKDFKVNGIGKESAADVVLSSAGWVAITTDEGQEVEIRAWTPEGRGIYLRTPAMLSRSVTLRGYKTPFSPAYTLGKQVFIK